MTRNGQASLTDSYDAGDETPPEETPTDAPDAPRPTPDPQPSEQPADSQGATADERDDATETVEDEEDDDSLPDPADLREGPVEEPEDITEATNSTSSNRGRPSTEWDCPACGASSSKCYRCSECGHDLARGGGTGRA